MAKARLKAILTPTGHIHLSALHMKPRRQWRCCTALMVSWSTQTTLSMAQRCTAMMLTSTRWD